MTLTDLDTLRNAIPAGRANGTTVPSLAAATGLTPRQVRQGFQELRRLGLPLVALPTQNGVFVATDADVEALKRTRDGLHSRAMSELVTVRYLDRAIERFEFVPSFPV
jgi:DNA-binding transcriptional regulator YhcF (GntR family)